MHPALIAIKRRFAAEHLLNFGSYVAARLIALALFAWSVSYYLSIASPSSYGEAALLLTVLSLLQTSDLGLAYAFNLRLTKALATESAALEAVVRGAMPLYLLVAGVVGLIMSVAAPIASDLLYGNTAHAGSLRYLAIAVSLTLVSSFFSAAVQAFNKLYLLNVSRGLADIFKAFALCIGAHLGVEWFALLLVLGSLLKLALDCFLAGRLIGFGVLLRPRISMACIRQDLVLGLPMFAATWLSMTVTVVDKIYVSRVFGPERLAYYSLAYDLSSKAFFLAFAVMSSVYVLQVRRFALGQSPHRLILMGFAGVCAIGLLYYLPLAIFAPDILRIWTSADLSHAATGVTRAAVLMAISYLVMNVLYNALQAGGRAMLLLTGWIVAVGWVACGLWLMPRSWGDTGVMFVLASAFAIQTVYYSTAFIRMLRHNPQSA